MRKIDNTIKSEPLKNYKKYLNIILKLNPID